MEIIKFIAPLFIIIGVVIILIVAYLRSLSNKAFACVLDLISANERCEYDLRRFLSEIPPLCRSIGIEDITYTISYLETTLEKQLSGGKRPVDKHSQREGYSVTVGIVPKSYKGERTIIYRIVLDVLFLLVEMDVLIRLRTVSETFSHFSRLQAFMVHDVKNLAQLIQTLTYNLEHLEKGREERFIRMLQSSVPMLRLKTGRILSILEIGERGAKKGAGTDGGSEGDVEQTEIFLRPVIEQILQVYALPGQVRGDGETLGEEYKVISLFDNLVRNVYEKSLSEAGVTLDALIEETGETITVTLTDSGSHIREIDRIFEPFHSTKSGGLGLGLFQCKQAALSIGADIRVRNVEAGVEFTVVLQRVCRVDDGC
jgi:signal transduction histidine kinase